MMDYESQLKLQAFVDGELPDAEARAVANWLAQDREAVALLSELRQTRQAMTGFETGIQLPESREFYWSRIEREIERLEAPTPEPAAVPWMARLRRVLMPAAALAVVVIGALLMLQPISGPGGIETTLEDSGALTYRDYSAGTTLVWLSYPADSEAADDDEMGTME